ncbi:hypothetical protein SDC9_78226 [bioreactor metagenome]|uniref:Uncharacterized protein n=1 Tax=bioreactor metagenome TaxID=1076179 RepID=A0A644YTM4_9ZZZZ
MQAVVFRAADGNDHHVVFLAQLTDLGAGGVLDVGSRRAEAGGRGNAVFLCQDAVNLGHGRIPEALFQAADRGVLEHNFRKLCGEPFALGIQISSGRHRCFLRYFKI